MGNIFGSPLRQQQRVILSEPATVKLSDKQNDVIDADDGISMPWNMLPRDGVAAMKNVVPCSILYRPLNQHGAGHVSIRPHPHRLAYPLLSRADLPSPPRGVAACPYICSMN